VAQCSCSAALQKWQQGSVGPHHRQLTSSATSAASTSISHTYLDTQTVARFSLFNSSTPAQRDFSFSSASSSSFFLRTHQVSPPSVPKAAAFSLAIRDSLHLVRLLSTQPLQTDQVSLLPLRKREYFLDSGFHCCQVNQGKCNLSRSLSASNCNSNSSFDNFRSQWI